MVNGLTRAVALDVHFSMGYIFLSDVSERNIKRSGIDGSSITTIITNIGVCDGLAVEWSASELYWTDTTPIRYQNLTYRVITSKQYYPWDLSNLEISL